MNDELRTKLEILTIEVKRQHKRSKASFYNVIIFCFIILVFFSLYLALLNYKIREIATPSTVAVLIADQFRSTHLPIGQRKKPYAEIQNDARDMAQAAMFASPVVVPALGDCVRQIQTQDMTDTVSHLMPLIQNEIAKNLEKILAGKELNPQRAAQNVMNLIPEAELEKTVTDTYRFSFEHLIARLVYFRKADPRTLTRKDLCEKDLLLCWLYWEEKDRFKDARYIAPFFETAELLFKLSAETLEQMRRVQGDSADSEKNKKESSQKK